MSRSRWVHRVVTVLVGFSALVLVGTPPATAEPPVAVQDLLTDRVGVLGAEAAEVQSTLEAVQAETGESLYVVLVDGFDEAGADWAEQVATQSNLGSSYLLFAMAVDDNSYQWWMGDTFSWDVDRVEELINAAAQPQILNGDWSGAITGLADGLRSGEIPETAEDADDTSWTGATTSAVIGGALLILLIAHQWSRRPGSTRTPAPEGEPQEPAR